MKKIIIILMLALLPGLAVAGWGGSNWDNYFGTSTNPIIAAYYNTLYANSILPLTPNTGSIGSAANAWDASWQDSTRTDYLSGKTAARIIIPATDSIKSTGTLLFSSSDKSMLRIGDTLAYQSQYSTTGGRELFTLFGTGAGIGDGHQAWMSIGGAGVNYGRGFFGGAYYGGADSGAAYIGANRSGVVYSVLRVDHRGRVVNMFADGKNSSDSLQFNKGLITDSTAYVLKRIFMRNDSLFFVVNTDTFRVVKK